MVTPQRPQAPWRILDLSHPSTYLNLALEEALARGAGIATLPTLRIWVNPPSVILGRFQDVKTEVHVDFCEQNKIPIARRFTGGGTVFHDEGVLNFSIATRRPSNLQLKLFQELNSSVILDMLIHLGLEGTFIPPNTVQLTGGKISGAAAAVGRDFAFWHASLLVACDADLLNRALRSSQGQVPTKFIRSRRQPVTTLEAELGKKVEMIDVRRLLIESCERVLGASLKLGKLLDHEERIVTVLFSEKYSTPQWNLRVDPRDETPKEEDRGTHTTIAV